MHVNKIINHCFLNSIITFILKEQPLLLEDLLEQEKREQEKLQNQPSNQEVSSSTGNESESALLSDQDFERLKADVFNSTPVNSISSVNQGVCNFNNLLVIICII